MSLEEINHLCNTVAPGMVVEITGGDPETAGSLFQSYECVLNGRRIPLVQFYQHTPMSPMPKIGEVLKCHYVKLCEQSAMAGA